MDLSFLVNIMAAGYFIIALGALANENWLISVGFGIGILASSILAYSNIVLLAIPQ